MAYSLEELSGSPTVTIDRKGAKGQRVFKINWSDRYLPLVDFIPDPYLSGSDVVIPPAATFPGLESLVINSIKIDPMFADNLLGDGSFPAIYDYAKLTVDYSTLNYDQKTNQVQPSGPGGAGGSTGSQGQPNLPGQQKATFVTHKISTSAEFLTWPNGTLAYNGTADPTATGAPGAQARVPEDQKFGILLPMIEHSITWHFVPYPPWQSIRWLIGNCNAYWFAGAPPETLVFAGCEADREMTNQGVQMYSLTYKFLEKNMNQLDPSNAFGWNHYLRTNGWNQGTFQIVNRKSPGVYSSLSAALPAAAGPGAPFPVRSRSGWPRQNPAGMYVRVDDEYVRIDVTANPFTVAQRNTLGSANANHASGAVAQTVQVMTLGGGMNATTNTMSLAAFDPNTGLPAANAFPQVGQMFLQVDNELMVVARRSSVDPFTYGVLRGVRGTQPAPHGGGSIVFLRDMPVYPMGDMRYLFLSGLVIF